MGDYLQQQRKLRVTTPLGENELLLKAFSGSEGISTLFGYRLEMIAENKTKVAFDAILGQKADDPPAAAGRVERDAPERALRPVRAGGAGRRLHGLRGGDRPRRLEADAQGAEPDLPADDGAGDPEEGLQGLRRRLAAEREVRAAGLLRAVPGDRLQLRRAADGGGGDLLLLQALGRQPQDDRRRTTPSEHPNLPGENKFVYEELEGGTRDENRIWAWKKEQEMRPGKYLLWDHCFELPHKHLEAEALIHDERPGGEGDAQAEGDRGRRAGGLRLPGRVRAAVRRDQRRAAASSRPSCRRSSATTSGRSSSGWTRRRRRPSSSGRRAT